MVMRSYHRKFALMRAVLIHFLVVIGLVGQAQVPVAFDLQNVTADAFPKVTFQFKVETQNGAPVWELKEEQIEVFEGGKAVLVEDFSRLSDTWNVKVGLVIDHSGSMFRDMSILLDSNSYKDNGAFKFDKTYKSPLARAKTAIGSFLGYFDWSKDSAQIIGFGTTVDPVVPYTNVEEAIYMQVQALEPVGLTAYYDALYTALQQMKHKKGPRAIVALTDGEDNRSKRTPKDVIDLAHQYDVPIYSIALGVKDMSIPERIGWKTGGDFYYAETAHDLNNIYRSIAQRILSTYQVTFISRDQSSANVLRSVQLQLDVDTVHLEKGAFEYEINQETIVRLSAIEEEQRMQMLITYTALGGGLAIGLLLVVLIRRKRKAPGATSKHAIETAKDDNYQSQKPAAIKVYPNKIIDKVTISYDLGNLQSGRLTVYGNAGKAIYQKALSQSKGKVVVNFAKAKSTSFEFQLLAGGKVVASAQASK